MCNYRKELLSVFFENETLCTQTILKYTCSFKLKVESKFKALMALLKITFKYL